jgi:hypothetical protein
MVAISSSPGPGARSSAIGTERLANRKSMIGDVIYSKPLLIVGAEAGLAGFGRGANALAN